jgi:ferredoxin
MADRARNILICSCEDTMPLDAEAARRVCQCARVTTARQLCRAELERFRSALATNEPLTVGCTQEEPLFSEIAAEAGGDNDVKYVNIRERAGWSTERDKAGPKMAALLAAVAEPIPDVPLVRFESEGVTLIYGRDERAIEVANLLKDHLDVTALITPPAAVVPPRVTDFPVVQGRIAAVKGHLGAFEIRVDEFARPAPSSRAALAFGPTRDGAVSRCDILIDVSGGAPFFPAADLRDGYVRADPDAAEEVMRAVLKARDLVGSFEKPRFINFYEELCAHSRSKIVGCKRCLDLCPTAAIAPSGDHVTIDSRICAGCGQCAAVCPTGAAAYALPPSDVLMRKLRTLLTTYREAGGESSIVLFHDDAHGEPLIDALARFGDGLPANVLPIAVNEVTQIGLETIAAVFAYGASAVRLLLRARARHDIAGLTRTIALAQTILVGLGFGADRVATIETDDPSTLGTTLRDVAPKQGASEPSSFLPVGLKRSVLLFALRELQRTAPAPVAVLALPEGAPFGSVELDVEGCTLCLACVSACPTGALSDDPEQPLLRFTEDACVQCGLCKATCPEKVITLIPQLDFGAATATARVLKKEQPFCCIRCGKPFGVKSTIERVAAKLEDKHWMFSGAAKRMDILKMCDNCRVAVISQEDFNPYGTPRPRVRTIEDYFIEREDQTAGKDET